MTPVVGRRTVLALLATLCAGPALALDPGVASGRFARDGLTLELTHAVALALENVEDRSERGREIRVLLTDREMSPAALTGMSFPPVWGMARKGEVRGLLLTFDPENREGVQVTVLAPPEPGYSLANISITNSAGVWSTLEVSDTRVTGELKSDSSEGLAARFSAPVFTDAVQADLTGPAAAAAEPVKAILARAEAMLSGDVTRAAALSTPASAADLLAMPPEVRKMLKAELPRLIRALKAPMRVVVREQTAGVMIEKGAWANARRIDGVWKAAD